MRSRSDMSCRIHALSHGQPTAAAHLWTLSSSLFNAFSPLSAAAPEPAFCKAFRKPFRSVLRVRLQGGFAVGPAVAVPQRLRDVFRVAFGAADSRVETRRPRVRSAADYRLLRTVQRPAEPHDVVAESPRTRLFPSRSRVADTNA